MKKAINKDRWLNKKVVVNTVLSERTSRGSAPSKYYGQVVFVDNEKITLKLLKTKNVVDTLKTRSNNSVSGDKITLNKKYIESIMEYRESTKKEGVIALIAILVLFIAYVLLKVFGAV